MEITKSHVQQLLAIVFASLDDVYDYLGSLFPFPPDFLKKNLQRDKDYVVKRVSKEGVGFLTVALPRLGDYLLLVIDRNQVKQRVEGFQPYDGLFPCFLRPVWTAIGNVVPVHPSTGEEPELVTDGFYPLIQKVRTLLLQFKKLEIPPSREQLDHAILKFKSIEDELDESVPYVNTALQRAQWVADQLLKGYYPKMLNPRHGPGAVAGGEKGNQKWEFDTYFESIHREWNLLDTLLPIRSNESEVEIDWSKIGQVSEFYSRTLRPHKQLLDLLPNFRKWKRVKYPTARVLFVPKDSRGPRTITCEPKELMYIQQGVSRHLVSYIKYESIAKGKINFDDQTVNQRLAIDGSKTCEWATLDLSDASDRVSSALVNFLFDHEITRKWNALRSTHAVLPNKEVIGLKKFAAMGSAMCFPVESLVFWCLCVGAVWEQTGDWFTAVQKTYIFGDDIIVPSECASSVVRALETVGLKVNQDKSYAGDFPFRESCGVEAFNGHDITPFRVRKFPPSSTTDGSGAVAWAQYADNCRTLMPKRAAAFEKAVEAVFGTLPRVPFTQSFLSFVDPARAWSLNDFTNPTWDSALCYYRAKLWALKPKSSRSDFVTNWYRLQKDLIESGPESTDPTVVVARTATLIGKKMSNITYLEFTAT